jgi:hypothetical protein
MNFRPLRLSVGGAVVGDAVSETAVQRVDFLHAEGVCEATAASRGHGGIRSFRPVLGCVRRLIDRTCDPQNGPFDL